MASVRQVKAARAMLGWSQADLAKASSVSYPTIARLETGDGVLGGRSETAEKITAALEMAGVIFVEENGDGPGVRLRKAWAFEGLPAISGHLGVGQEEAAKLISSGALPSFKIPLKGTPCVTQQAMRDFIARKRHDSVPAHLKLVGPATDAVTAMNSAIVKDRKPRKR